MSSRTDHFAWLQGFESRYATRRQAEARRQAYKRRYAQGVQPIGDGTTEDPSDDPALESDDVIPSKPWAWYQNKVKRLQAQGKSPLEAYREVALQFPNRKRAAVEDYDKAKKAALSRRNAEISAHHKKLRNTKIDRTGTTPLPPRP
jgi:hypothetical protein